jgi:hypothetical protein
MEIVARPEQHEVGQPKANLAPREAARVAVEKGLKMRGGGTPRVDRGRTVLAEIGQVRCDAVARGGEAVVDALTFVFEPARA